MSNFDNPFADPNKQMQANTNTSPFSDPSVQQARGSQPSSTRAAMDEFSPFSAEQQQQQKPQPQQQPQPAILPYQPQQQQQPQPPPAYSASAQQRITSEELERRQRELEAKARELERREEEQRRREAEMASSGPGGPAGGFRQNNWPPLPAFSPVGPCFYQDIDVDIPSEFRSLVRLSYYLWLAHVCLLLVNILGTLAYFIGVQAGKTNAGTVFGVSLIVCVAFVPASYVCWFRPLYKAFKNDSSFNFFLFFVMFFVQFGILAIQCLGLDYLGSCGWINAFVMMKQSTAVGMFMLLIALCFTALAGLDMALLVRVHRIYRSTGASFAKARQEFSQGVLANEAVRGAAADAAAVSARSAFTGGGSGGGGGRY
ncbi:hypothetical protein BOX15_Mlig033020g2 [Macrostomum lignano]|uniref:Secretory carrier-associated membrane protein n=2 Tax=Macrostomum lignano TaxID=282301 RepID=A0A267E399_9PLAT|nr:hypothetical protein BOX15_Mlig033020g2 [Macrostomum lignano]